MTLDNTHVTADCAPARDILSRVGDTWSMLIVILLGDGPMRFGELRRSLDGVSQRMLSLTLKHLERDGFVSRHVTPSVPPRVDYDLTPLGRSLSHPIKALGQWAIRHHPLVEQARAEFDEGVQDAETAEPDAEHARDPSGASAGTRFTMPAFTPRGSPAR